METVNYLKEQGLQSRPLQEQLETSTSGGKLIFHVFGAHLPSSRVLDQRANRSSLQAT
jgi:DNA invertase Pin-like site-specific DNA recombinase